jgi:alpha-galactosidase/6-phospho-beta-glucosidase family protein
VFTLILLCDILSFPELAESEIALMDIDAEPLLIAEITEPRVAERLDVHQLY